MAQVTLKNVSKHFGDLVVVKDVNIEIKNGEFIVLVGPSGCGKTTTLRMIAGLEEITKGEVIIGDRVVNNLLPKDRDIAMVFQNYALYPHMNVYENMSFGLRLRKFKKDEIDKRVKEAASILEIEQLLYRKPKELSGGQRQRVAMGRAIVRKPEVFLFDEPLSNLDAKLRVQMRAELGKLHRRLATTSIYVTHDQVEAMTLADRIVVMKDGVVQQIGSPMEVYQHPQNIFVAGFIGSPSMNFIEADLIQEGDNIIIKERDFSLVVSNNLKESLKKLSSKRVVVGVRPENIYCKYNYPDKSSNYSTLYVEIDVIEPLGSESHIFFTYNNIPMVTRVKTDTTLKVGEKIELIIDPSKIYLFDKESGKLIGESA